MKPGRLALNIHQGATFRQRFVWKAPPAEGEDPEPKDLTGWKARAQFRVNRKLALTFDSEADDGSIEELGDDGAITLYASAEDVSAVTPGTGSWTLEMTQPDDDVIVLMRGKVTFLEEVTE